METIIKIPKYITTSIATITTIHHPRMDQSGVNIDTTHYTTNRHPKAPPKFSANNNIHRVRNRTEDEHAIGAQPNAPRTHTYIRRNQSRVTDTMSIETLTMEQRVVSTDSVEQLQLACSPK
ncbi:MAG: hypothetical protein ACI8RD_000571 [Bacillariaceae sp.]|jgi:hypothetical protein